MTKYYYFYTLIYREHPIDSILTVVDAESLTPNHYDSEATLNQLIFADIILLNKTDLVAPKRINQLEDYIRSLMPSGFDKN